MKFFFCLIFTYTISGFFSQVAYIYFKFDSYQLNKEAKYQLAKLDLSNFNDTDKISIIGLADTTGDKSYNYRLALHRAEKVQEFISNRFSIPSNQFIVKSEGEGESKSHSKDYRIVKIAVLHPTEIIERQSENQEETTQKKDTLTNDSVKTENLSTEKTSVKDTNALVIENFIVGKKIRLHNIQFYPGTPSLLNQKAKDELDELLQIMKDNPTIKIDVQGHVCCTDNYELSEQRALTIKNYLINHNISEDRITYSAYSNHKPVVHEIDNASRQINRRVEILVTGK